MTPFSRFVILSFISYVHCPLIFIRYTTLHTIGAYAIRKYCFLYSLHNSQTKSSIELSICTKITFGTILKNVTDYSITFIFILIYVDSHYFCGIISGPILISCWKIICILWRVIISRHQSLLFLYDCLSVFSSCSAHSSVSISLCI